MSYPPVQRVLLLSPHGVMTAVGFLLGARLLLDEVRRRDLDPEVVVKALTWSVVGVVVGARLDYVISQPDNFHSLGDVLAVWRGGIALFGGFIGGVLAALPVLRKAKVHLPRFLDAAAPGFALGVVMGRIGDLVIADHLGNPAPEWAKAISFTIKNGYHLAPGFNPSPAIPGDCAEPGRFYAGCTYLLPAAYDLVGVLALFLLLMWLRKRATFRAGSLICVWGLWYGVQRVVLDNTRSQVDEHFALGPVSLTGTQILAVVLAVVCGALLLRTRLRGYGLGETSDDPPSRAGSLLKDQPEESSSSSSPPDASSTPSANPLA